MSKEVLKIIEEERIKILQSYERKRKYVIKFKILLIFKPSRYYLFPNYSYVNPDYLKSQISNFCSDNAIKLKKIKIKDLFSESPSYISIHGIQNDQKKLFKYLILNFNKYISLEPI